MTDNTQPRDERAEETATEAQAASAGSASVGSAPAGSASASTGAASTGNAPTASVRTAPAQTGAPQAGAPQTGAPQAGAPQTGAGHTSTRPTAQQPFTAAYSHEGQRPGAASGRHPARFGTILWGVLLLVFAGLMIAGRMLPFALDPVTWITGGLIAIGLVLVVAGIAAAMRRR
ncbi:hypothetical protein GCM10027416_31560 [Okibacterium endophyticum]